MNLDQLAIKYNTDKSSKYHNYAVKYDKILKDFRNEFKSVLEIGIGGNYKHDGGESLRMWKEYFFNSTIYGIDIIDKTSIEEDRIKVLHGDQSDSNFLKNVSKFGPFDLIVDDGSHRYEHQIFSYENLFSSVKPGGFYIVEDVCTSYWEDWGFGQKLTAIDYFKTLIDDVNYYGLRIKSDNNSRNDMDRRESWLDSKSNQKFQIYSIQFLNSSIVIQKK